MTEYTCSRCSVTKPLVDFPKSKAYAGGIRKTCKACRAAHQREYWTANPDKYAAHKKLTSKYRPPYTRHGLTKTEYEVLFNKYSGLCWSCKDRPATSIDHDHTCCDKSFSCGKCVRGILCHNCNSALGLLKENKGHILNLHKYIKG